MSDLSCEDIRKAMIEMEKQGWSPRFLMMKHWWKEVNEHD